MVDTGGAGWEGARTSEPCFWNAGSECVYSSFRTVPLSAEFEALRTLWRHPLVSAHGDSFPHMICHFLL